MLFFGVIKLSLLFCKYEYFIKNMLFIIVMEIIMVGKVDEQVVLFLSKFKYMDSVKFFCVYEVINLYSGEIKGYNLNLMKLIYGICFLELFM